MSSIRLFLVAGILATLTLSNFVAALRGYQSSMAQADDLFDNEMLELARLISHLDVQRVEPDFRLGNDLAFQIWEDGRLLAASYHAPTAPISAYTPGFDYANFNGYRWRTYAGRDRDRGRWVMVAERGDLRFVLAENVVLESILPILLSIPLAGILTWLVVSHGLAPLRALAGQLKNKQANDLSPLEYPAPRRELDQVIQSINAFIARLSAALEREKRFSADAAHELRTPISALKVQLHNLSEEVDTGNDSFQQLREGVERMQHLVEQLLALYRMTPEEFAARRRPVDVHQLAQELIARQYEAFERKGQSLELAGRRCVIQGDAFALETLLANLLDNAGKYTPPGGSIMVRIERGKTEACLLVEDSGPGIAQAGRERVYERFFRAPDVPQAESVPGCGLGLAIVKQVADMHGARLSLHDSPLGGCAFQVCFPLAGA